MILIPFYLFISLFVIIPKSQFDVNSSSSDNQNIEKYYPDPPYIVLKFKTKVKENTEIQCLVYIPDNYDDNTSEYFPLLTFLHGADESGTDLEKVKKHGPFKLIENGKEFPFIVIAPQLPIHLKSKWQPELVHEAIELAKRNFRIDSCRLYLTGISLGGAGVWGYAEAYPDKVAAIAPICAWGNPANACKIKDIPTWAFHGAKDNIINPEGTSKMIDALKKCGANPNFTLYPEAGHDSWTITYNNPTLYDWFLTHSRSNTKSEEVPKGNDKIKFPNGRSSPSGNILEISPEVIGKLPVSIQESSGLWVENHNSFWTHNDSGGSPVLYNLDSTGKILQIKRITNATNLDWEDLTSDDEGNLYIGDFGNNKQNRKMFQIYKIPNPRNFEQERIQANVIEFSLPDQTLFPPNSANKNFDIEAMISFNDYLYLFSKNNTIPYNGYSKMYKLSNKPGKYIAQLVDSVYLGESYFESSVTGAALSKDYSHLILLSYSKLTIFSCFEEDSFFSGRTTMLQFSNISQKEALSFFNNRYLYLTDEVFHNYGGYLYKIDTRDFLPICPETK